MSRWAAPLCVAALAAAFFVMGAQCRKPMRIGVVRLSEILLKDPAVKEMLHIEAASKDAASFAEKRFPVASMSATAGVSVDEGFALRKQIISASLSRELSRRLDRLLYENSESAVAGLDASYRQTLTNLESEFSGEVAREPADFMLADRRRLFSLKLRREILPESPFISTESGRLGDDAEIATLTRKIQDARNKRNSEIIDAYDAATRRTTEVFASDARRMRQELNEKIREEAESARKDMLSETAAVDDRNQALMTDARRAREARPKSAQTENNPGDVVGAAATIGEIIDAGREDVRRRAGIVARARGIDVVFDASWYAASGVEELTKACEKTE